MSTFHCLCSYPCILAYASTNFQSLWEAITEGEAITFFSSLLWLHRFCTDDEIVRDMFVMSKSVDGFQLRDYCVMYIIKEPVIFL